MVRVEHALEIARPPADVFAYLTDISKLVDWQATLLEMRQEGEGPLGVGTRLKETRKFLGRRIESELEVTAFEPDRQFDLKTLSGPVPFTVRHTLTPSNGGTRVEFVGEGEPGKVFRMAERLVAQVARRQFTDDLETLKDRLEGQ